MEKNIPLITDTTTFHYKNFIVTYWLEAPGIILYNFSLNKDKKIETSPSSPPVPSSNRSNQNDRSAQRAKAFISGAIAVTIVASAFSSFGGGGSIYSPLRLAQKIS